jgi:acetoin utilization protein AcuB
MRAFEVMSGPVHRIAPTAPAAEAFELMATKQIHHLAVMQGSTLVGVVSDRDIGGRKGASLRKDRSVADLMTPHVVTVDRNTPLRKVANLMRGRTIGCLLVTSGNRMVGIVTIADLLELVGRGADHQPRASLHYRVPHRKKTSSSGMW